MAKDLSAFTDAEIEAEQRSRRLAAERASGLDSLTVAWRAAFPKRPFGDGSGPHVCGIELTDRGSSFSLHRAVRMDIWAAINAVVVAHETRSAK